MYSIVLLWLFLFLDNITVEYGKDVEIKFKVDASPPATITWYEDNKEIKNSAEIELVTSSDSSIVKFKNSGTRLTKRKYCVRATNGYETVTYEFKITVTGVGMKLAVIKKMLQILSDVKNPI